MCCAQQEERLVLCASLKDWTIEQWLSAQWSDEAKPAVKAACTVVLHKNTTVYLRPGSGPLDPPLHFTGRQVP